MKRIWAQCIKELAQFRRDRLTLALAFLLPLLTLLIFGFAIRLETKDIPLAVQDFDLSPLSRAYIERLFATNQLKPTPWAGSGNPASAINQGIAKAAVVIPPDFTRRIKSGKPTTIQILVDGTDTNNARVIQNSIKATTNFFLSNADLQPDRSQNQPGSESLTSTSSGSQNQLNSEDVSSDSANQSQSDSGDMSLNDQSQSQSDLESSSLSSDQNQASSKDTDQSRDNQSQSSSGDMSLSSGSSRVAAHVRIWFNPGRKESLYIVPGVFAVILWIYPSLLSALAMVRDKEQGTILQVYASSLSAVELLLGKGLAYFLVGLGEAFFIMSLGLFLFRIWFAGDPTPLLVGTPIFLITSVLFGLFIGVRASTLSAAVQGVATIGFLTALLLSGFIYPLSNIPFPLSLLSSIIPARYYIELTRDAFVRGTGWVGVWYVPLILALLGLLLFTATWQGLRRMQLPE